MQYDHNSERFGFSMPRDVEGHDMTECDRVEVHYRIKDNSDTYSGVYEVDDMMVDPEDDTKITFSWLLSQNVTQNVGAIAFSIRFACVDDDANLEYAWSTSVFTGISVSQGMYNGDAIVEEYVDVLEQWKQEFLGDIDAALDSIIAIQNELLGVSE